MAPQNRAAFRDRRNEVPGPIAVVSPAQPDAINRQRRPITPPDSSELSVRLTRQIASIAIRGC
jgi:hypothetical protein